jgi:hypothetical protein
MPVFTTTAWPENHLFSAVQHARQCPPGSMMGDVAESAVDFSNRPVHRCVVAAHAVHHNAAIDGNS